MRKFKAFNSNNDEKVNETWPSNSEYYSFILKKAISNFLENSADDACPRSEVKNQVKETLDKYNFGDYSIIGYIEKDKHYAYTKDKKSILIKIADEENKYFYKWVNDDDTEVKSSKDEAIGEENKTILNKLKKVNALIYDLVFIAKKAEDSKFSKELRPSLNCQKKQDILFLPIVISEACFQKSLKSFYCVYVSNNAKPLYLDSDEEDSNYQYVYNNANDNYKTERTWKYNSLPCNGDEVDNYPKEDFNLYKDWRYNAALQKYVLGLVKKNMLKKGNGTRTEICKVTAKELLDNFDTDEGGKQAAKIYAERQARFIPPTWNCFYYKNNSDNLDSFLSGVSIAEGSGGSRLGGYAMRADKVSEVYYLWFISANSQEDLLLAKLLSYIMKLDQDKRVNSIHDVVINLGDETTKNGFYPTNWPAPNRPYTKAPKEAISPPQYFHYYKKFPPQLNVPKRNKPDCPDPPRITHSQATTYLLQKYDQKLTYKLNKTSYRIWKKGDNFQGQEYKKTGVLSERQDAGSVMADALNNFLFYSDMIKCIVTKVTYSKLPATSFAQYVIHKDETAKDHWKKDNNIAKHKDADVKIKTQQEWCHLFGHGDGGPEELGNFVSGSKHCNTEQLSIEIGQRRVIQGLEPQERGKFKAKITAYLIPNKGTWIGNSNEFQQNKINDFFKDVVLEPPHAKEVWIDRFFKNANKAGCKTLKKIDELQTAFEGLSDNIKKAANNSKNKKGLFKFRRVLEEKFFTYFPVARWMRYKIFYNDKKIFDHIYDAQSQSFDYNECQILDYTVERAIYEGMDKKSEYITKIIERGNNLLSTLSEDELFIDYLEQLVKKLKEIDEKRKKRENNAMDESD